MFYKCELILLVDSDSVYIRFHFLSVLSSVKRGILKSPTVIVDLSISFFNFISVCCIASGSVMRYMSIEDYYIHFVNYIAVGMLLRFFMVP